MAEATQQFHDFLHMAEVTGKPIEWIDKTFRLESGKIICGTSLKFTNNNFLISLPSDLSVEWNLSLLKCISLISLPTGLSVGNNLDISRCTSLTSLPTGLRVGNNLYLLDCTSLVSLPDDMKVNGTLFLSKTLKQQVILDAEKLKTEGKIGNIEYI